jgi:hypothetical protein
LSAQKEVKLLWVSMLKGRFRKVPALLLSPDLANFARARAGLFSDFLLALFLSLVTIRIAAYRFVNVKINRQK